MRGRNLFLFYFVLFLILTAAGLALWTAEAEKKAHYTPQYQKVNLESVLQKEQLSEEDYTLLAAQTGLAKAGVDELYQNGNQEALLYLQERFFEPIEYECERSVFLCCTERIVENGAEKVSAENLLSGYAGTKPSVIGKTESVVSREQSTFLPAAQDGDILVTFSGHLFGWRSGHAGLVVNAAEGRTLEAITLGCNSQFGSLENWKEYPCFALLRLSDGSQEKRAEIAAYAAETLVDIPYRLASFCGQEQSAVPSSGTQCAHLVWLTYRHFGYDVDGDGGQLVTPRDLYQSDLLEVIQVYGICPE